MIIRPDKSLISLIIPCFNEEASVPIFLDAVKHELSEYKLEIIFINDGSEDETLAVLQKAAKENSDVQILNLSRNFGKEAALTAGLDYTTGDCVIPIDVDLQDPLSVIPEFLAKWREGYDVVYGMRENRKSDSFFKRLSADKFYKSFNKISEHKIPPHTGDFRLMDKRVVETLRTLPEKTRFMKGLFSWVGYNSIAIPYIRVERAEGTTKFSFFKLWRLALDGIFSFSVAPLRLSSYLGAVISILALLYAAKIVIETLIFGIDVPGYASLVTIMLFIGGLQLLSIGIIGEYISRIFTETKSRPIYILEGRYSGKMTSNTERHE